MATRKKTQTLTDALALLLQKRLLPDLHERATQPRIQAALERRYNAEKKRTADSLREYTERTLEQVGAAWILSCVFVRTLEDRRLLARNRVAGEGAEDSEQLFFELAPSLTARDYLLTVFQEVASLPGAEDVLGVKHNAAFKLSPSNDGARALLDFFRERDASGGLRWQFAGDDTRFLGDLYQDLSEQVRKRYALLQTPHFVESFILDHTLEPAIAEYGLETVRIIDPACGSGHFLLGAFQRLLDQRLRAAPGVDVRDHALAALGQVYGVDVNPYAVAIARFRLTLAYLARCGFTQLAQASKLQLNLVVADSLLHGAKDTTLLFAEHESARGDETAWDAELFALDEPEAARRVFGQRYHAVVGNPPYITCKDNVLRDAYRSTYKACHREYALAAPFTERFFHLAVDGGFVGLINSNSFMKREFGKALIEKVLPHLDLTRIIDSAGAYIPGHGTPTVFLFGRNRRPVAARVRAVLGKRGEPSTPDNPVQGVVWRSIVDHGDEEDFENDYVSVTQVARATLNEHPWSLGGGGAAELKELLERNASNRLGNIVASIGFMAITKQDDVFSLPDGILDRYSVESSWIRCFITGENVRDWAILTGNQVLFPYDESGELRSLPKESHAYRFLWPYRAVLESRAVFGGQTFKQAGRPWYAYGQIPRDRIRGPVITFAEVATHNHFVLDRGGKVFNRTAPIIKLPESATEDDHLALLAYLNSSTASFCVRQLCQSKGAQGVNEGHKSEAWEQFIQRSGTALAKVPVPSRVAELMPFARQLEQLAVELGQASGSQAFELWFAATDAAPDFDALQEQVDNRLRWMVTIQEELDWHIYEAIGLLSPDELLEHRSRREAIIPDIRTLDVRSNAALDLGCLPGHRPFEQVLHRDASGTRWFVQNGYEEPKDLESQWVRDHATLLATRVAIITTNRSIALLETPEHKRRWGRPDVRVVFRTEARRRALELMESVIGAGVRPATIGSIARPWLERGGSASVRMLGLIAGDGTDIVPALCGLVDSEHVPFLSVQRFTATGLAKHSEWNKTWELQRHEDLGERTGEIPLPRKYDPKDYQSATYWQLRGKLDVPRERFISYPGCEKDGDPTPLIGSAGWSHLQRAQALIALYQERKTEDGWSAERLTPMLVGLHELMFWLELWHSGPEAGSKNPAREFKQYLDAELSAHRLTVSQLEEWRPAAKKTAKGAKKGQP